MQYKVLHTCGRLNCWSLRCSWSIASRRCSNYIFILNLLHGFNRLGKHNCKTKRETFWDLVRLILEIWRCFLFHESSSWIIVNNMVADSFKPQQLRWKQSLYPIWYVTIGSVPALQCATQFCPDVASIQMAGCVRFSIELNKNDLNDNFQVICSSHTALYWQCVLLHESYVSFSRIFICLVNPLSPGDVIWCFRTLNKI